MAQTTLGQPPDIGLYVLLSTNQRVFMLRDHPHVGIEHEASTASSIAILATAGESFKIHYRDVLDDTAFASLASLGTRALLE